jgi:hypothetical protein
MTKYLKVLIKPSEVFKQEKEKASIKKALLIYLIVDFIVGIIYTIGISFNPQINFALRLIGAFLPVPLQTIKTALIVFYLFILPILSIILVSIFSLIGFIIARLLKGQGSYRVFLYFGALYYVPIGIIFAILSQIPNIGQYVPYVASLYVVYPFTIAIKEAFNLSLKKAILIWLIPYLIISGFISFRLIKDLRITQLNKKITQDFDLLEEATKSDDINICKKISDNLAKEECIAVIDKDTTKCPSQIGYKNDCYRRIGIKTNNLNTCSLITDPWFKSICYKEIAINTNNVDLCKSTKFYYDYDKDECISKIAIRTNNLALCSSLSSTSSYPGITSSFPRDNCYKELAKINNDVDLCLLIDDSLWRVACVEVIAKNLKDSSLCNKLSNEATTGIKFERDSCLRDLRDMK